MSAEQTIVLDLENIDKTFRNAAGKSFQAVRNASLKVAAGEWHVLKIRQRGDKIECFLDDKKYLTTTDQTFTEAGKAGLWTKADAQTYFDGFEVRDLKD